MNIARRSLAQITLLTFFALSLVACTSNPYNQSKGKNLASPKQLPNEEPYHLPTNYQEHREQQRFFTTAAGSIAYTDNGASGKNRQKVLVLIHGVPTSSWMYRKILAELSNDFRVISIDLLGYGNSDKPAFKNDSQLSLLDPDSAYSNDAQADYVTDLLQALDIEEYSLLFHDMGGLVAWRLISRSIKDNEALVNNVFALNTIIGKQGFEHPKFEKGMMAKQFAKSYANQFSSAALVDATFRNMGLTDKYRLNKEECLGYVIPLKEGSDSALYSFFTGINQALFSNLQRDIASLKNYKGTINVIWGAKDKVLTVKQLDILRKHAAASQLTIQILNDHSHFVAEENPQVIADTVRQRMAD